MKARGLLVVIGAVALLGCPPDYLDLGADYQGITTGGTATTTSTAAPFCTPGETQPCYTGPESTLDVGECHAGNERCNADGTGFGACEGEVTPDKEDCSSGADKDCDGQETKCGGSLLWARRFGASENDRLEALTTFEGDVFLTGHLSGMVDFGDIPSPDIGGGDAFVARLTTSGSPLWVARFGDPSGLAIDQTGTAIVADQTGSILVAGTLSGTVDYGGGPLTSDGDTDVFVLKLLPDGSHVWSRRFGGPAFESVTSIAVDNLGDVLVTGSFLGVVDFGGGPLSSKGGNDIYVLKLSPTGEYLWAKAFGDPDTQKGLRVASDSAGDVLVSGYFGGAVSFGGPVLVAQDQTDAFVVKLAADGTHAWSTAWGGPGNQQASGISAAKDGSMVVAGAFEGAIQVGSETLVALGPRDALAVRADASGSPIWSQHYGDANSAGPAAASATSIDGLGNLLLTGSFEGVVDFGTGPLPGIGHDAFVLKLAPDGSASWSRRFGAMEPQFAAAIAADASDHVLIGGWFFSAIDIDPEHLISAGGSDIFVARLSP